MSIPVAVWGVGNVGRHVLRMVLDDPDLRLVAVRSQGRAGEDAGVVAGRAPVGVVCTDDERDLLAAGPACVVHCPLPSAQVGDDPDLDTKVLCRLLAAGVNVVTTVGYVYPKAYGPDVHGRLEAACAAGGTSLHGTGVNPGFMSELVPLLLSGLCARIDSIRVVESSEFSRYPSPEVIVGMMGFGRFPDEYERHGARYRRWLTGLFSESVLMVADGLGVELDRLEVDDETELTAEQLTIAAGTLAAGTVAAQRWTWTGVADGAPFVTAECVYRAHPTMAPHWEPAGWVVELRGKPDIRIDAGHWLTNGLLATAAHAVHAIGPVVAAPPGVRTLLDLPLLVGRSAARRR